MVPAVASIKKKMIEACSKLIIVADHTKIGRVCVMPVAPLKSVDYIITDDGASPEVIESIRATGINVMVAPVVR
jgi:DeoR/GlpR family transcriptional regulator of sugar metabolism